MEPTKIKPEPGVYKGVPFADYLAWDAVSNSRLNLARRSLLHYKESVFTEPSEAMRLGSFVHCGVLEPEAVALRYVVIPRFEHYPDNKTQSGEQTSSTNTKWYKAKVQEFIAVNSDKEVIEQETYRTLLGINKALAKNRRAAEWLSEPGDTEVSIVWSDDETRLLCKARLDYIAGDRSFVADLKTTRDAQGFAKAIANFGYHRQAAHYLDGVIALYGGNPEFRIVAVEPTPVYGVRSAPVNEDTIEIGRSEVRQALRAIANAYEKNEWPGYEDPSSWCLPAYYGGGEEIELMIGGELVTI
jgi:hypothetical protein